MRISEVAQLLEKSERTIYYYISKGYLPRPSKREVIVSHKVLADHIDDDAVYEFQKLLKGN